MAILAIQAGMTKEGLETLANMVSAGTIFSITKFRLTPIGNTNFFNSKKVTRTIDIDKYYLDESAIQFESDHGSSAIDLSTFGLSDTSGYISIYSKNLGSDLITVEIECYIPPTIGTSFSVSEIMIYTGQTSDYRTFCWGIFPEITKRDKYGLNIKVILEM